MVRFSVLRLLVAVLVLYPLIACGSDEPAGPPPVTSPPARSHTALVFSPSTSSVLLYGGVASGSTLQDIWSWNGSSWTRTTATSGLGAAGPYLYSDGTNVFVVRERGEVSRLDGTQWVSVSTDPTPPRLIAAVAYDVQRRRFVRFGGSASQTALARDTWEFDGQRWTLVTETGPSPRAAAAMAYDPVRRVTVLFGGYDPNFAPLGDMWEWNGQAWRQVTATGPSARFGASMVFDAARSEMLLFGGITSSGHTNELWRFSSGAWTRVQTATAPAPRSEANVAFDPVRGNVVLFGGEGAGDASGETWTWDGTRWTNRTS